jgi:non-canonical (house-cleaning) NTP pyrophosphatase
MKIIVSSASSQKLTAVQMAFQNTITDKTVEMLGYKASSGINEQPVGKDEISLGCNNRLSETMKNQLGDIYVSIENGIELRKEEWHDFGYIIIYIPRYRKEFDGVTESVIFPTDCVEEAMRRGFDLHTVGSVIAERNPGVDKQDPQLWLTGKSRVQYLVDTIEKLIVKANSQYLFNHFK